jgi:hypothetical protein
MRKNHFSGVGSVRVAEIDSDEIWVTWRHDEVYHQVTFIEEEIDIINMTFYSRGVSGEALVNCLGNPDFYRARVQPDQELSLYYSFLYLEQGIELSGGTGINGNDPRSLMTPAIDFDRAELREPDILPRIQAWESWRRWTSWEQIEVDRQPN